MAKPDAGHLSLGRLKASLDDLPKLLELAERAHAESIWAHIPFDVPLTGILFRAAITRLDMCCLFSGDGFLIGDSGPLMFCRGRTAWDLGFYSEGKSGPALLRTFVEWAKSRNCVDISCGTSNTDPRLRSLYNRAGFQRVGDAYQMRL